MVWLFEKWHATVAGPHRRHAFRAQFEMLFENRIRRHRPGHSAHPVCRSLAIFQYVAEMATKAAEYKATRRYSMPIGEKAIANRAGRAHGQWMHNHSAGAELFAKAGQA